MAVIRIELTVEDDEAETVERIVNDLLDEGELQAVIQTAADDRDEEVSITRAVAWAVDGEA